MRATRTLTTAAVLIALTGFAGCGSDDTPADAGAKDTDTSQPSGDSKTDTASSEAIDICTKVSEAEIGEILGGTVTRKEVPGGGCSFDQDDPRAPSIALASNVLDEGNGGFEGAITGVSGVLEGDAGAPVDGVGEKAYAKTGTAMGGENQQGGGLVLANGNIFQVTLIQGNGLSADKVKAMVVATLTLMAAKA